MAMGFSLAVFFSDLEHLLSADMEPQDKLAALEKLIAQAKKYARVGLRATKRKASLTPVTRGNG